MSNNRLAIDVGGTFVDFVHFDEASNEVIIEKVPSSGQLEERFFEGIGHEREEPVPLRCRKSPGHGSPACLFCRRSRWTWSIKLKIGQVSELRSH